MYVGLGFNGIKCPYDTLFELMYTGVIRPSVHIQRVTSQASYVDTRPTRRDLASQDSFGNDRRLAPN